MANIDRPFGLRYIGNLDSSGVAAIARPYTVLASDATALFLGDGVKTTGTEAVSSDGYTYPVVTQAAAGDTLVGNVIGFDLDSDNLTKIYRPASTLRTVLVIDSVYALFEIQVSSDQALVPGDVGLNADIKVGTGDTVTGLSGVEIDLTTAGSATAQLRIMRVLNSIDNETGAHAKVIVMINEHRYKTTVGV
jgi:hypothetical protein